jgi:hypothetical protein
VDGCRAQDVGRSAGGSAQSSAAGLGWRRRGHSWQPPGNITHTNEGEDEGEDVDVDACVDVEQAAAGRSRTQERQDVDRVDGRLARLNRARARAWTDGRSLLPQVIDE